MKNRKNKAASGFSLIELLIAMTIMLVVLGLAGNLFSKSLGTRQRESSRTDALTAAQAALNVMSREIANSGYGLKDQDGQHSNGIVLGADSGNKKLHFLSNVKNDDIVINAPGENVTYFFEPVTKSILRYDAHAKGINQAETSIVINRISDVEFQYFDYTNSTTTPQPAAATAPTASTARVRVKITVALEDVQGQMSSQKVVLVSDVALRNSKYMLQQY
jgi:prepilin-type N-terminal cleavage/methylation domain-containing protein